MERGTETVRVPCRSLLLVRSSLVHALLPSALAGVPGQPALWDLVWGQGPRRGRRKW